ncbi:MAG: hypothetical protein NVSMB9_04680 [Isosphaeraceae bacterium]
MTDQSYVHLIAASVVLLIAWQVVTKRFDPFAPVWMFLVGYLQVYVIQAITLREWALGVRGNEVVTAANFRALWGVVWFLTAYFFGVGRLISGWLPRPPQGWSAPTVWVLTPFLTAWGLFCAWAVLNQGSSEVTAEGALLQSFPFVLIVAGVLLIVTGLSLEHRRLLPLTLGVALSFVYIGVWVFNGKRSPALMGILATICAVYIARQKRPSWPILLATAFVGSLFVAVAINWRNNLNYERSASGFVQYLGDFEFSKILTALNVEEEERVVPARFFSHETLEYGGFLLMLDTVPEKSDFDYGINYLRCISTFIPRILWPDKPLYGRDKWVSAWIAGSEMKRDETFTSPSIGILGATQLNGGGVGTFIVLGILAQLLRTGYEYFRRYPSVPWIHAFWSLTYFNAWYTVVADDPMTWFYYNWGFSCLPILFLLFVANKFSPHTNQGETIESNVAPLPI